MIRIARNSHKQIVYDMWKTVFGDSDEYMQLYFSEKYRSENTFLYFHNAKAVSSLQILPFRFTFWGEEITMLFIGIMHLAAGKRKRFHEPADRGRSLRNGAARHCLSRFGSSGRKADEFLPPLRV